MPKSILIFKKILIIVSVALLAVISYRFITNKYHSFNNKNFVFYRIDQGNKPCEWKDGQIVSKTKPANLSTLPTEVIQKAEEADFLHHAAASNDCVYLSD